MPGYLLSYYLNIFVILSLLTQSFVPNTQQCDPSQIQKFAATMTSFFQNTDYIAAYAPFGMSFNKNDDFAQKFYRYYARSRKCQSGERLDEP